MKLLLRQCFHETGFNWNRDISGTDRSCVSVRLLGTVLFGTANWFKLSVLSN